MTTTAPARVPICLLHGAATTAAVWRDVLACLDAGASTLGTGEVRVPQRRYSGSLDTEIDDLADAAAGAVVVGVSGGATLGLELAARGVPFAAALLHEPAVGSLLPGLLDAVAAAYRDDGAAGFGAALYGSRWTPAELPADPDAVGRDLAMFRAFEPRPPAAGVGPVLLSVGAESPEIRHRAAAVLAMRFGYPVRVLPGSGHCAHLDAPRALGELAAELSVRPATAR